MPNDNHKITQINTEKKMRLLLAPWRYRNDILVRICSALGGSWLLISTLSFSISAQSLTSDEVAAVLVCQCGCGLTVLNCNHVDCPSGIPMEKKIEELIAKGLTKEEIVQEFVKEYGEVVLAAPPKKGFHLAVWYTPFIALSLGLLLVTFLLIKWSRRNRTLYPTPEPQQDLNPSYLSRIEEELKEREKS